MENTAGREIPARRKPSAQVEVAELLARLAAVASAPLAVVTLRLFGELRPTDAGVPWLLLAAGGASGTAAAAATVMAVTAGIQHRSPRLLARAAAVGTLTSGVALAALGAVSDPDRFPDPALAIAGALAASIMLAATRLTERAEWTPGRVVALVLVFGVVEASLATSLLLSPGAELAAWLFAAAAALFAISAVPGPWLPSALVAAGLAAMAAARPGTLEALPAILALGAGALAAGFGAAKASAAPRGHPAQPGGGVALRQPGAATSERHEHPEPPGTANGAVPPIGTAAPAGMRGATDSAAEDGQDEADRLARELRGTLAELLQARRTIELQRDELLRATALDALTGVASRTAILERLRFEAAEARRYRHPIAVLLLDLDQFAAFNRQHGWGVGDEVLREVALRLRLRMRGADALGRVGGDSFLAILPHTDEAGAAAFADALIELLRSRPIETYDGEMAIGVSIGLAFMRAGMAFTDDELLAEAEVALASAQEAGGNQVALDRMHGLLRLDELRGRPGPTGRDRQRSADSTT